ncbi:unnamed protein product [Pieris brassicae]|uniref:Uncharacterized protein n=1 Tax=Pieris brassicae TaxID=7116 RepID=A0A9P0TBF7_PIEBR|nr:unnamed protein product [Pieris brassicae]
METGYNRDKPDVNREFNSRQMRSGMLNYKRRVFHLHLAGGSKTPLEKTSQKSRKYLVRTKDKGILLKRNKPKENIDAYSNSDYAEDPLKRRSTSGSVLMIVDRPISWSSKRQPIVALSSTEAEYIAAADYCKEALYLKYYHLHTILIRRKMGNVSSITMVTV